MRIGFVSVSIHARTGYGRMCREIISRLIDKYEVMAIGHESDVMVWGAQKPYRFDDGRVVTTLNMTSPLQNRGQAANLVDQYCKKYDIDYLLGHWDVWALPFLSDVERPFGLYVPIDGAINGKWAKYFDGAHKIIAYSLYGYEQLKNADFPASQIDYIPHGVNTDTFKPLPNADKQELRKKLPTNDHIPEDAFLLCSTQANIGPRKMIPLMLQTFAKFVKSYPQAHLYMHTNALADSPMGYDIPTLCEELKIRDHVHWPRSNPILEPASDEELNDMYNASDVYITNSSAEGFGLPVLEAMSAGLPVICPDNTSHTELVKGRGWLAKVIDPEEYVDFPVYVPTLQQNMVTNQRSLLNCMTEAYHDGDLRKKYSRMSREFALGYDWSHVMKGWYRHFEAVEGELTMFNEVRAALKA